MAEYTGLDKRLQYLFQHADYCKVVSGYYYDGQMYKDSAHTELITGSTDCLYIDKSTTTLYLYDGSAYEEVQGGGGGSTVTITPTLSTGTKIADYSIDGTTDSLYAPNGGSSSLDGLTDVTITTPSDGQALLYDSTTGEWVNGTVQGGGSGVPGTAGVRMSISIPAGGSIIKTFEELGIVKSGYYIVGMASAHAEYNGGWKWIGVLSYSGTYTSSYPSSYIKSIDYYYTEVSMQEQAKTLTFRNTSNNWGMSYALEVLPLHPSFEIDDKVVSGYYHDGDFYEDQSYTQIITGDTEHLYIDQLTNTLYLYDGTAYEEVKGSGGITSDGTVGTKIGISFDAHESKNYDFSDLNIPSLELGAYMVSVTCNACANCRYIGVLYVSAYSAGANYIHSLISYQFTVSISNETLTFTSCVSWSDGFSIEILPLHPKIEIKDERRYFDVQISANSSATYSLEDLKIKEKGAYFVSFVASNAGYANYLGVFMYSGEYNSWQQNNIYSIRNINCSVSFDNTTGIFTFSNTTSYGASWRIEICPASPNIVETTSGADSLSELSDVSITTPTDGQLLSFDSASSKWINTDAPNSVISGYYDDGEFYEDQSYTQIITGQQGHLYIDLNTTTLYLYDGMDYVEVQGGSSGGGISSSDIYLGNIVLYTGKLYGSSASSWANFMLAYRDSTGTSSNTLDYTLNTMINTLLPNGLKGGTVKYRLSLFAFGNSSTPIKVGINGQELISAHNPWAGSTRYVDFTMSDYFTFDDLPHETAYAYTTTNDAYNFKIKTDSNAGFDTLVLHAYLVGANTANTAGFSVTEEVLMNTPTTTTTWMGPVSVEIDRNSHLMVSVELGLSDNPQIRNTVYNFSMEELKNNELGSHYILIPNENIAEGSTYYTHPLAYVCLDGDNFTVRVPDGNSLKVNRITAMRKANMHTYSTTEQIVGTWIDGKTIYEKTLVFLNNQIVSGDNFLQTGISDMELVIDVRAFQTNSDHTRIRPINTYEFNAPQDSLFYEINMSTGEIRIRGNGTWPTPNIYFTIRYTKSTT